MQRLREGNPSSILKSPDLEVIEEAFQSKQSERKTTTPCYRLFPNVELALPTSTERFHMGSLFKFAGHHRRNQPLSMDNTHPSRSSSIAASTTTKPGRIAPSLQPTNAKPHPRDQLQNYKPPSSRPSRLRPPPLLSRELTPRERQTSECGFTQVVDIAQTLADLNVQREALYERYVNLRTERSKLSNIINLALSERKHGSEDATCPQNELSSLNTLMLSIDICFVKLKILDFRKDAVIEMLLSQLKRPAVVGSLSPVYSPARGN